MKKIEIYCWKIEQRFTLYVFFNVYSIINCVMDQNQINCTIAFYTKKIIQNYDISIRRIMSDFFYKSKFIKENLSLLMKKHYKLSQNQLLA